MKRTAILLCVFSGLIGVLSNCTAAPDSGSSTGSSSSSSGGSASYMSLPFYDDFSRTDSGSVGNGWKEVEGDGDAGKKSSASLQGGKVILVPGEDSTTWSSATIYQYLNLDNVDFRIKINFTKTTGAEALLVVASKKLSHQYLCRMSDSAVSISFDGGTLALDSYAFFDASHDYSMEMIRSNSNITLTVTDKTSAVSKSIIGTNETITNFGYITVENLGNHSVSASIDDFMFTNL